MKPTKEMLALFKAKMAKENPCHWHKCKKGTYIKHVISAGKKFCSFGCITKAGNESPMAMFKRMMKKLDESSND
jgi:hypothetical protein